MLPELLIAGEGWVGICHPDTEMQLTVVSRSDAKGVCFGEERAVNAIVPIADIRCASGWSDAVWT